MLDQNLKQWATQTQQTYIDAVNKYGSARAAAKELGLHHSSIANALNSVRKKAAIGGYTPDDGPSFIQSPMVLRGKSTLYGADGEKKLEWVKTRMDQALATEAIEEWIGWLAKDAKGMSPAIPAPKAADADLLAVYPMGDPHFGMYAWGRETGEAFDLDIAERLTRAAVDRLVTSAPPAETALILELGDFFHADNNSARTPQSGAQLDVDTRWQRVMQVGLRTMIYCIQRTLEKHNRVVVRIVRGNHDPHSSVALALALDAYFHNQPRIEIDLSPAAHWYFQFGKVLIGCTHGDTGRVDNLPGVMAADVPSKWGATAYRYWYHGHIHHDSVKEFPGCMIESFRTLASKDAWHAAMGYRSGRDMKIIVHHRRFGEVERHRIDIAAIEQ